MPVRSLTLKTMFKGQHQRFSCTLLTLKTMFTGQHPLLLQPAHPSLSFYILTAARFFAEHHLEHLQYHRREIQELSSVRTLDKMEDSEIVRHFRSVLDKNNALGLPSAPFPLDTGTPCRSTPFALTSTHLCVLFSNHSTSKYHLKLCTYSFELLFSFVLEHKYNILQRILNQRLKIESASALYLDNVGLPSVRSLTQSTLPCTTKPSRASRRNESRSAWALVLTQGKWK
jgi:hypothetical protein